MGFCVVMMVALLLHKYVQFKRLGLLLDLESQFALHLINSFVDAHEFLQEVGARKNQVLGEVLARAVVHAVSNIALP
jgi:hypothetical protein